MATTNRTSLFTLGLLCGAVTGAVLGLLFAPKPGDVMRRDLARSASELKRRAAWLTSRTSTGIGTADASRRVSGDGPVS